jgi:hypothetical protein
MKQDFLAEDYFSHETEYCTKNDGTPMRSSIFSMKAEIF